MNHSFTVNTVSVIASNEDVAVAEVDSDVAAEKKRVHTADIDSLKSDNVLVVKYVDLFSLTASDAHMLNRCISIRV